MEIFRSLNGDLAVTYCTAAEEVACNSDAIILLTQWEEYAALDWGRMSAAMKSPYILDTRNFLSQQHLEELGFLYEGLGIGTQVKKSLPVFLHHYRDGSQV